MTRRARLWPVVGLLALLGLGLSPPTVRAQTFTLQQLLNGQTITIGGLTFANFRDFSSIASGPMAAPVDPNLVTVTGFIEGANVGIRFQSATQFLAGPLSTQDTLFSYDVFTTDGSNGIFGNTAEIEGFGTSGTGLILVGEAREDENKNPVPDISTPPRTSKLVSSNPGLAGTIDQATFLSPQNFLTISKDIGLSGGTTGAAFLSDFEQTFAIPEPSSLALVGLSALGLAGYRWRRRKLAVP
jgi:hypothetical protein